MSAHLTPRRPQNGRAPAPSTRATHGTRTSNVADPRTSAYLVGTSVPAKMLRGATHQLAHANVDMLLQGEPGTGKRAIADAIAFEASRSQPIAFQDLDGRVPDELRLALSHSEPIGNGFAGRILYVRNVQTLAPDELQQIALRAQDPVASGTRVLWSVESDPVDQLRAPRDFALSRIVGIVRLCIPPLRHRKEDIAAVVECWRRRRTVVQGSAPEVEKSTVAALREWSWPGNATELLGVLDQAAETGSRRLTPGRIRTLLPKAPKAGAGSGVVPLAEVEMSHILATVERCGNNHTHAARVLGIGRSTLIRKLKRNEKP